MAKKIKTFQFTPRFKKSFKALPQKVQSAFEKKLELFLKDMTHPSLRVKRIQGTKDRWEGSVTMKYRFTFQFTDDSVIFRNIGTHKILEKESRKEQNCVT